MSVLLALAAFSSSWTGASFGRYSVTDSFLVAAAAAMLVGRISRRRDVVIYWWMIAPIAGIVLVIVVDGLVRQEPVGPGITMLTRLLLGTSLLAIVLWSEARLRGGAGVWFLIRWWAAGVVVNSVATILIGLGLLSVRGFIDQPPGDWRTSGLAFHPNSLALALTIALPIAVLLMMEARSKWGAFAWAIGGILIVSAVFFAASRAGLIVGIPALGFSIILALAQSRARMFTIPGVIAVLVAAYLWVVPALGATRLTDQTGANSDVGRVRINDNALRIILGNPMFGGGADAETGVAIPLQVLTIGGLAFAILYYTFLAVPSAAMWRNRKTNVGAQGLVYVAALLGFSIFNPGLSDRASLWPLLVIGAFLIVRKEASETVERSPSTGTRVLQG